MFKSFKINLGGSKSDCCSINIQAVANNTDDQKEENKECCVVKIDMKQNCCE